MAKDHGPSVKNDKQYEGLRKEGDEQGTGRQDRQRLELFEEGRGKQRRGGSKSQKQKAGRKGGKKSS
jgi:hypothetical protein